MYIELVTTRTYMYRNMTFTGIWIHKWQNNEGYWGKMMWLLHILCFYLADRCRDCLTFCQWCLQKNLIIQKTSSRWSLIFSINHCVFHNASEKFSNGYKATDQKNMRFKYMNWPWQIYFDYLVTCCQIYFKKVLTLCGCMRVYINSMHILVTAWTSDKYFFGKFLSYLFVCLSV